jgi:hypothetical protein
MDAMAAAPGWPLVEVLALALALALAEAEVLEGGEEVELV